MLSGAAGTGKTTAGQAIASRVAGTCAIDGDTLSSAKQPWDYDDYWAFTMRVCADVLRNGLVPVICGIGLPSQVFPAAEAAGLRIDMLALVCDPDEIRRRIVDRGYGEAWRTPEKHLAVDAELRRGHVPPPHRFTTFDTGIHDPAATADRTIAWADAAVRRRSAN